MTISQSFTSPTPVLEQMVSGIVSDSTKRSDCGDHKYMKSWISLRIVAGFTLVTACALTAETHTGWWRGRKIVYRVVNGSAIWQGDMVVRLEDISSDPPLTPRAKPGASRDATFVGDPTYLWANGTIPYTIGAAVPSALRGFIASAIQTYANQTQIHWIPRTTEADYVIFKSEPATANECAA